jgi:hypothetical protein
VVETGGLENRFTLTGNGGSNPSPSAIYRFQNVQKKSYESMQASVNNEVFVFIVPPFLLKPRCAGILCFMRGPPPTNRKRSS